MYLFLIHNLRMILIDLLSLICLDSAEKIEEDDGDDDEDDDDEFKIPVWTKELCLKLCIPYFRAFN